MLARSALNEVDNVCESTDFETVFLFFVAAVHDRSRQVIRRLSLNDEVEHVVYILWCLLLLFLLALGVDGNFLVSVLVDPQHPEEIT